MGLDLSAVPDEVVQRYGLDRLPLDREQTAAAELLRLDGKRALVTGGGGDGLGAAICARLAEQGTDVAVLDISPEAAAITVASLRRRWRVRAEAVVSDIGDGAQVRAAADGPRGVTVAGVCPGIMVSDRTVRAFSDPRSRGFASLDDAFARVSLGRATVVDEVAGVVAFLVSEAGSLIHGTSLSLGGGMAD